MRICIEGCAHGDLQNIYEQIRLEEEKTGQKVDLLICCGKKMLALFKKILFTLFIFNLS
jgi:hypothetical protein